MAMDGTDDFQQGKKNSVTVCAGKCKDISEEV